MAVEVPRLRIAFAILFLDRKAEVSAWTRDNIPVIFLLPESPEDRNTRSGDLSYSPDLRFRRVPFLIV